MNVGGPAIQAATLSDRLTAHGFHTHLVHGALGEGEGDMTYLVPAQGVALHYLPWLQRPVAAAADARALANIYRLLCHVRPAIVHTHMAKAGALGRAAAIAYNRTAGRSSPARIIHTYHGHVLDGYFRPAVTSMFLNLERLLARASDTIVAISGTLQRELVDAYRIGTTDQYRLIPLGFDLTPFRAIDDAARADARVRLGLPAGVPVVATVGRLTAIKRHQLFLETVARVKQTRPDVVALVAGDGELRHELESYAKSLGLDGTVRWLGWRRDLATVYGATDVFVLTSRNEGTPVAMIEAMASGVPPVSTDVGGVKDVIESAAVGVRIGSDDAASLAEPIEALLANPNRRRAIGDAARERVLGRFGIDRLVDDVTTLYRDLLSGR
jgi:glycosyltransferase involved in cell wall biosynthesis